MLWIAELVTGYVQENGVTEMQSDLENGATLKKLEISDREMTLTYELRETGVTRILEIAGSEIDAILTELETSGQVTVSTFEPVISGPQVTALTFVLVIFDPPVTV